MWTTSTNFPEIFPRTWSKLTLKIQELFDLEETTRMDFSSKPYLAWTDQKVQELFHLKGIIWINFPDTIIHPPTQRTCLGTPPLSISNERPSTKCLYKMWQSLPRSHLLFSYKHPSQINSQVLTIAWTAQRNVCSLAFIQTFYSKTASEKTR